MSIKSTVIALSATVLAITGGFWYQVYQAKQDLDNRNASQNTAQQGAVQPDSTQSVTGVQTGSISNEDDIAAARKAFSPIQGMIMSPARRLSMPDLVKHDGSKFELSDIKDGWNLWFFGYTHCPDICPATMGMTASAKRQAEKNGDDFPGVIFVSVDPARDSVKHVADYVTYFDKDFVGVTGSDEMIKALSLQMSVVYMKMQAEADSESGYLVDHSSALLVTNPEGHLVASLNPPHVPATILKDLDTLYKMQ